MNIIKLILMKSRRLGSRLRMRASNRRNKIHMFLRKYHNPIEIGMLTAVVILLVIMGVNRSNNMEDLVSRLEKQNKNTNQNTESIVKEMETQTKIMSRQFEAICVVVLQDKRDFEKLPPDVKEQCNKFRQNDGFPEENIYRNFEFENDSTEDDEQISEQSSDTSTSSPKTQDGISDQTNNSNNERDNRDQQGEENSNNPIAPPGQQENSIFNSFLSPIQYRRYMIEL